MLDFYLLKAYANDNSKQRISRMDFFLNRASSLIFASIDLTDRLEVANSLNKKIKDTLDGEPVIFPFSNDAPPDIPRIIIESKDRRYHCDVSMTQISLNYEEEGVPHKQIKEIKDEYLNILTKVISVVKEIWKCRVTRIGFVIELMAFPNDPIDLVKSTFIRDNAIGNSKELQLSIMNRLTWEGLEINKGYRILTTEKMHHGKEEPEEVQKIKKALAILIDINTPSEKVQDFSTESMLSFFNQVFEYLPEDIKLLLPTVK